MPARFLQTIGKPLGILNWFYYITRTENLNTKCLHCLPSQQTTIMYLLCKILLSGGKKYKLLLTYWMEIVVTNSWFLIAWHAIEVIKESHEPDLCKILTFKILLLFNFLRLFDYPQNVIDWDQVESGKVEEKLNFEY